MSLDDCTTYADVMARAKRVADSRKEMYKRRPSLPVPALVIEAPPPSRVPEPAPLSFDLPPRVFPSVRTIIKTATKYFGLDYVDFLSTRRQQNIVRPRQIAIYVAKRLTPLSYPELGRRFGGKDHTTILHACRLIDELKDSDLEVAKAVKELLALFDTEAA